MSTDAEVVKVSKHLAIAEHAEDTEDVTEQSVMGKLDKLIKSLKDVHKVMAHAEKRHMSNNLLPHETISQITSILDNYDAWEMSRG